MNDLPSELVVHILSFCGTYNYVNRGVCTRWRTLLKPVDKLDYYEEICDPLQNDDHWEEAFIDSLNLHNIRTMTEVFLSRGYVNLMNYFLKIFPVERFILETNFETGGMFGMKGLIKSLDMAINLYEKEFKVVDKVFFLAASQGREDVLKWMEEREGLHPAALNGLISVGKTKEFMELRARGYPLPPDLLFWGAYSGKESLQFCLTLLIANLIPTPPDFMEMILCGSLCKANEVEEISTVLRPLCDIFHDESGSRPHFPEAIGLCFRFKEEILLWYMENIDKDGIIAYAIKYNEKLDLLKLHVDFTQEHYLQSLSKKSLSWFSRNYPHYVDEEGFNILVKREDEESLSCLLEHGYVATESNRATIDSAKESIKLWWIANEPSD